MSAEADDSDETAMLLLSCAHRANRAARLATDASPQGREAVRELADLCRDMAKMSDEERIEELDSLAEDLEDEA